MKFSIIIPTTGMDFENQLGRCLQSIYEHTTLPGGYYAQSGFSGAPAPMKGTPEDFEWIRARDEHRQREIENAEVIVVFNGAQPETVKLATERHPHLRSIVFSNAIGYPKAINAGITKASGEILVLMNDDTYLTAQPKDRWLELLAEPFSVDPQAGITGPLLAWSEPADAQFVVFFIAAIKRAVYEKIGPLDEEFTPGGGEDTDYCIRASAAGFTIRQAPTWDTVRDAGTGQHATGIFPAFHDGEATVNTLPNWPEIFHRNSEILRKRYNRRAALSNQFERAVIGRNDPIPPRERARYEYAAKRIKPGSRVLEIGCSSGYGWRFFKDIPGIKYHGIDKDEAVLKYAWEQFVDGELGEAPSFEAVDVNAFHFEGKRWDAIVAFEVLEHIENGRELAEKLKSHAGQVFITMPRDEPPGFWGPHHKLHRLTEKDFPGYSFETIREDGTIGRHPAGGAINLLLGTWPAKPHVLAAVPTRGRWKTSLPATLLSIALQTRPPEQLMILNDGPYEDPRAWPEYAAIFKIMAEKGIAFSCVQAPGKGQHLAHEISQAEARDLIWRIDDDEIAEPDVLEKLLRHFEDPTVGAAGGTVGEPPLPHGRPAEATGRIADINRGPSPQWFAGTGTMDVEHLHSSFLYRAKIANYPAELSPAAHREETIFSHEIYRRGFRLVVDFEAKTWHFRNPEGGIRIHPQEFFDRDEQAFCRRLEAWGESTAPPLPVFLVEGGRGDVIVFRSIIPELRARYGELTIAAPYAEALEGLKGVRLISREEAIARGADPDRQNVYGFMASRGWTGLLRDAYRELYLGGDPAPAFTAKRQQAASGDGWTGAQG